MSTVLFTYGLGSVAVEVPERCCLTCKHCTDLWYDYTFGPYMTDCEIGKNIEPPSCACESWEWDEEERPRPGSPGWIKRN